MTEVKSLRRCRSSRPICSGGWGGIVSSHVVRSPGKSCNTRLKNLASALRLKVFAQHGLGFDRAFKPAGQIPIRQLGRLALPPSPNHLVQRLRRSCRASLIVIARSTADTWSVKEEKKQMAAKSSQYSGAGLAVAKTLASLGELRAGRFRLPHRARSDPIPRRRHPLPSALAGKLK